MAIKQVNIPVISLMFTCSLPYELYTRMPLKQHLCGAHIWTPLGSPMWAHLSLLDERSPFAAPRCPFLAPVVGLTIQSEIEGFLTFDFVCTFLNHHRSFGSEKPSPIHCYWSQSPRWAPKCSRQRSPWVRLPKRYQSCVMNVCII